MRERNKNPAPELTTQPQPKRIRKPVGRFSGSPAPLSSPELSDEEHTSGSSPPRPGKQQSLAPTVKKTVVPASTSRSKRPRQPTAPKQVKQARLKSRSTSGGALVPLEPSRLHGNLSFTDSIHQQRYNQLLYRDFVPCKAFNAEFLKELGVYETVLGYMTNIGWAKLLDYDYPVYTELTQEFYATFERSTLEDFTLDTPNMVRFRMLGTMYGMSYNELNVALGLFREDLSDAPDISALYGNFSPEFKHNRYKFWSELVSDEDDIFDSRSSRASGIVDFSLRIIHKWMSFSVSARPNSAHIVSKMELFFLWCMKRNVKADFARWLAREFDDVAKSQDKRLKRGLSLGVYITKIAVHKGLIDVGNTNLHVACKGEQVDKAFLKACRILKENDGVFEFVPPEVKKGAAPNASGTVDSHVHEFLDDIDREAQQSIGNEWGSKLADIVNSQTLIMEELVKIKRDQEKILTLLESYHPPAPSQHSSPPNST